MLNKPYSESCEQNKKPILAVIEPILTGKSHVLEIGSGTGQHAVCFAGKMPHIRWQCSDRRPHLDGIRQWLSEAALDNLPPPLELDVTVHDWPLPALPVDVVFTANTFHIMHRREVERLMIGVGTLLPKGGEMLIYGPFNYHGAYTSASNEQFDDWLKSRDPHSGIRDFELVEALARDNGLQLVHDYAMPANNRILHFLKSE